MGTLRLRRRVERAFKRLGLTSGILMYHRIARETHDPWGLCVTPEHFAEQMEVLRRTASCDALLPFAASRWPRRAGRARVAVTFDDGYRDNVTQALPILERCDVPATVFVVSGAVGSSREFWWDTLERCVLQPSTLPEALELTIGGVSMRWSLAEDDTDISAGAAWCALVRGPSTARQHLFLDVWNALLCCDPDERNVVLDKLMVWADVGAAPETRLPMGLAELLELAEHPLITIGCHTHSHASLPDLSPVEQRIEVESGRHALEEWTGRKIEAFAYPYGRYDEVGVAIARDLAFAAICTTEPLPVTPLSRRWELPRLQATDGDGEAFERWLHPRLRGQAEARLS